MPQVGMARKHMECQKRGASSSDDDDNDDDEDAEDEDEDLAVLQSILDISQGSGDGTGLSGADRLASAWMRKALLRSAWLHCR